MSQKPLSPRAGIAWTPASGLVVRAGAGRFVDRVPLVAFDRVLARDGQNGREYDASSFDEQPQNPSAPGLDRGPSSYDQRHRFVASALFDLPIGDEDEAAAGASPGLLVRIFRNIEVAPILTIASGLPVNAITGVDTFGTHAWPLSARPSGWSRNALRLPATATLDLRVLKYFPLTAHGKLDLVAEAFNLLNRTNVTAIDPVFGTGAPPAPGFERPLDAASPRQIQFSIDFEF